MPRPTSLLLLLFSWPLTLMAEDSPLLQDLLRTLPPSLVQLTQEPQYEVQIVYTQVDRDAANEPQFTTHQFGVEPDRYFYPASTVKFPVALFALEKLSALAIPGLDRSTPMILGEPPHLSISDCVRKVFLVSDNDAFNRLFSWVGMDAIQQQLAAKRCINARIVHRLSIKRTPRSDCVSPAIHFPSPAGESLYQQAEMTSTATYAHGLPALKGVGYLKDGVLIEEPKDFTENNWFPMLEQQALLRQLIFPDTVAPAHRVALTASDRAFVLQAMSDFPREEQVFTDDHDFEDDYVKALLGWHSKPIRGSLRCYNKSGQAYGYMIDNAYVVDLEHGVEFFLSAIIHLNANGIYNDDTYQYDSLGYPFFHALGRVIHDFECRRERPHHPDFSSLGR